MKKILKWVGIALLSLVILVGIAAFYFSNSFDSRLTKAYEVTPAAVQIPTDSVSIAEGKRLASIHCTGCHGGSFPSAGIDLSNYNGVQAVAASGQLMGAVTHAPGYAPMPQGGNKLSECEITQLQKWVDSGTPSN